MANYQLTQTGAQVQNLLNDISNKAPTASPALTGVPTAPTAAVGTDTTQIATTAFVQNASPSSANGIQHKTAYKAGETIYAYNLVFVDITGNGFLRSLINSSHVVGSPIFICDHDLTENQNGNIIEGLWSSASDILLKKNENYIYYNLQTRAVYLKGKIKLIGNVKIFEPDSTNPIVFGGEDLTNANAGFYYVYIGTVNNYGTTTPLTISLSETHPYYYWTGTDLVPIINSILIATSENNEPHLKFSRQGINYITYPSSGSLVFSIDNNEANNRLYTMNSTRFSPYSNNTRSLGDSTHRWLNFYGVNINNLLIATSGRAAVDNGANTTPRYVPAKWCFSTGEDPVDGNIYTIKIPYAGGTGGVYMSVNGDTASKYYPVIVSGTTKFTTHYDSGETLTVIFEANASAASAYDLEPVDNTTSTKTGGAFRVINYRDTNTNTLLRTYASATNIDVPLIGQSSAAKTTAAWSSYTGTYKDWYGVIPNDDAKRAKINLSTGLLTVPGGVTIGASGSLINTLQVYGKASFDNDIEIDGNLIGMNEACNIGDIGWEWNNIYANNYIGSATLTGTPTAPTAAAGTNTTQIATTAFVQTSIVDKVDKEAGKGLSTNDFTDSDKNLLEAGCVETKNRFNLGTDIILGKNGTGDSSSIRAITVALNTGGGKSVVSVKNLPLNLKYQVWGYNDDNFTSPTNYTTTWIEKRGQSTIVAKPYVRVLFGTVNNATITMADFEGLELQVEEGEQKTDYAPKYTAFDYVARNRSYPVHLKVCSYNVGMYSNGISTDTPAADALENMSGFLGANNFDILGIQEGRSYVNGTNADETVYNDYFISQKSLLNNCAIKSQFVLKDTGEGTFTAGSRKYVYATAIIGNKEVFIINVHLALTATDRASNYTELLALLKAHEYFIAFGDFNAAIDYNTGVEEQTQAEYNNLINAGYTVANGGRWGLLTTIGTQTKYPDNICVSSNIKMITSKTANVYTTMNSDHIPIIAELVV